MDDKEIDLMYRFHALCFMCDKYNQEFTKLTPHMADIYFKEFTTSEKLQKEAGML